MTDAEDKHLLQNLRAFQKVNHRKSLWNLFITTGAGILFALVGTLLYSVHWWYASFAWIPLFIVFCRSFVLLHDCGHFSLFKSRRSNQIAGNIVGFFIMIPHDLWRFVHSLHHASVGNLDKRHLNPEMWTLTVEEYQAAPRFKQWAYRATRSKLNRLLITPVAFFIVARLPLPVLSKRAKISVILYDLAYLVLFYVIIQIGYWNALVFIYFVPLAFFYIFASTIFYLQHQFEETSWVKNEDWSFYHAALHGSSYLKFGPLLQWLTGNVGFHHLHHLNSKIPFYHLAQAHQSIEKHFNLKPVRFTELFKHLNMKVWYSDLNRLVSLKSLQRTKPSVR